MKVHQKYFLASLLVIALVAGGGYYYHTETLRVLRAEYDERLAGISSELGEQGESLTSVKSMLVTQGAELESKITEVEEEHSKELARVERESERKTAELEKELGQIDIETKGFTSVIEDVKDSIVSLRTDRGYGSGFVVGVQGYVMTNYHVVAGINALSIEFADGRKYPGRIAGWDEKADLAILKIASEKKFPALSFGRTEDLTVGQKVIALGNPAGLDFTVTEGIISSTERTNNYGYGMIQTSVPINPGNSGGPLIDGNGMVVGVNTFKITGAEFEGLGFAMNPDNANSVANQAIRADQERLEEEDAN